MTLSVETGSTEPARPLVTNLLTIRNISALGLRRVGYGTSSDLLGACPTDCAEGKRADDRRTTEKGFRWPPSLVSQMSARVVDEASRSFGYSFGACRRRGSSTVWLLLRPVVQGRRERAARAPGWRLVDQGLRERATRQVDNMSWSVETGSTDPARPLGSYLLTFRFISALGLRRVGYGISLDLLGAFPTDCAGGWSP